MDPFGKIKAPQFIQKYGGLTNAEGGGLIHFFNNILRLLIVFAGVYAFLNFVIAGYGFMSAGGDPKAVSNAWARIWKSLLGLLIIVGSFVLAAIFGYLLFGDAGAILNPQIYGPEPTPIIHPSH